MAGATCRLAFAHTLCTRGDTCCELAAPARGRAAAAAFPIAAGRRGGWVRCRRHLFWDVGGLVSRGQVSSTVLLWVLFLFLRCCAIPHARRQLGRTLGSDSGLQRAVGQTCHGSAVNPGGAAEGASRAWEQVDVYGVSTGVHFRLGPFSFPLYCICGCISISKPTQTPPAPETCSVLKPSNSGLAAKKRKSPKTPKTRLGGRGNVLSGELRCSVLPGCVVADHTAITNSSDDLCMATGNPVCVNTVCVHASVCGNERLSFVQSAELGKQGTRPSWCSRKTMLSTR